MTTGTHARPRGREIVLIFLVAAGGALVGFFLVFAGLFSDGPTSLASGERLTSLGLVAGALIVLAGTSAHYGRGPWWKWALLAGAPSLPWLLLILPDTGLSSLWLAYAGGVLLASAAAAWFGTGRPRRMRGAPE